MYSSMYCCLYLLYWGTATVIDSNWAALSAGVCDSLKSVNALYCSSVCIFSIRLGFMWCFFFFFFHFIVFWRSGKKPDWKTECFSPQISTVSQHGFSRWNAFLKMFAVTIIAVQNHVNLQYKCMWYFKWCSLTFKMQKIGEKNTSREPSRRVQLWSLTPADLHCLLESGLP